MSIIWCTLTRRVSTVPRISSRSCLVLMCGLMCPCSEKIRAYALNKSQFLQTMGLSRAKIQKYWNKLYISVDPHCHRAKEWLHDHCSPGPLQPWTTAALVHCSPGPLQPWSTAALVHCSPGPLKPWSTAALVYCSPGPLQPWSTAALVHCSPGPLQPWSIAALVH